jgi:hypothetical protein
MNIYISVSGDDASSRCDSDSDSRLLGVARRWYCASARHWLHPLALVGGWLAVG